MRARRRHVRKHTSSAHQDSRNSSGEGENVDGNENDDSEDDEGMVYSMMHGYKIPLSKIGHVRDGETENEKGEGSVYQRTLEELHDVGRELQTRRAQVRVFLFTCSRCFVMLSV
jgi:hypothetical protein